MSRCTFILGLAVLIAAGSAAQTPVETRTVEIHDVADLLAARDAKQPDAAPNAVVLAEMIRNALKLGTEAQVVAKDRVLVVNATTADHTAIRAFLQDMRRWIDRTFDIRMQFVTVPKGAVLKTGGKKVQAGPLEITLLESQNPDFGEAATEVVEGPRITCAPFLHSAMSIGTTKRLIREWRREEGVLDHEDGLYTPVIEDQFEGTAMGYCVYPFSRDGADLVRLDVDIQVSWIDGEIRRESTPGGPVHRCEFTTRHVDSSIALALGSSFLAGPFPAAPLVGPDKNGRDTYFLATVSAAKSRSR